MNHLFCYKTLPVWNAQTLPNALRCQTTVNEDSWVQLTIHKGSLELALTDPEGRVLESQHYNEMQQAPWLAPKQWHRIASTSDDLECQLSFHCDAVDYFSKKHGLTRTHSELIEAVGAMESTQGKALDLGCGRGRNSLYLRLCGFTVDAWDANERSLETLRKLAEAESLDNIDVQHKDLNHVQINGQYDFILSTVVFMFLQPESIPRLIGQMQEATLPGGYNLIVAAMSTEDCPCPESFSFTFSEGELSSYYQDWEILKYNENYGSLHRTDAQGNRVKMRFATLFARKPM